MELIILATVLLIVVSIAEHYTRKTAINIIEAQIDDGPWLKVAEVFLMTKTLLRG